MLESETHSKRINYSALFILFESLSPTEQDKFMTILNITRMSQLPELLNQSLPENDEPLITDYFEYQIHRQLLLFIPPVVFVLGIVGNFFSFITLNCRSMRRLSTCAYLSVLALADSLVLTVGLLRLWIAELTGIDLRNLSQLSCGTINVVASSASDFSVWLIMAVTAERFIVVYYPLRVSSMCNRRRASWIMTILLVTLSAINSHFFWTTELSESSSCPATAPTCGPAEGYRVLLTEVWPWIDAFLYSLFPFVVILALNVVIVLRILSTKRHRATLCGGRRPSSSSAVENTAKLSVMLLAVSFAFLATTLPMNATLIAFAIRRAVVFDRSLGAKYKLVRTVCELLMYANHSTNFFLYCATGNKFRQELCAVVRRLDRSQRQTSGLHSNELNMNRVTRVPETEYFGISQNSEEKQTSCTSCTK